MRFILLLVCVFSKFSFALPREIASAASKEYSQIGKVSKRSDLILTKPIEVAALGRVADLGDLYDARRDRFLDISLYSTDFSGDAVHSTDRMYSAVDYVRTESLSEKMEKLGVQAGLALSFLGGMVQVSGSGRYLNDEKKSSKSAKASLIYSTRTVRDELKIFSEKSKNRIDTFLLENIEATHVVVGIDWGANVVASLEETDTRSSNLKEIQGRLEGTIKTLALNVSGSVGLNFKSYDVESSSSFSFHVHGDVIPNTVPQTLNEFVRFIRDIPDLIKRENKGKGVAMNYVLMPLQTVQKVLQTWIGMTITVNDINQELIDQFMGIFQEVKDSSLEINDVYNSLKDWRFMVPEREFTKISEIKSKFNTFTNDLRTNFSDLIVKYRSGDLDAKVLVDLITSYENSTWTPASISTALEAFSPTMQKTGLLNLLQDRNALFINRKTNKYKILEKNFRREIRIISADLSMNISSPYVYSILNLLNVEKRKRYGAMEYYIEDVAISVPMVKAYSQGNVLRSFPVGKKEYVLLADSNGIVIIVDSNSLERIIDCRSREIQNRTIAVVGDTFYSIDAAEGKIKSTPIERIMNDRSAAFGFPVGSFPSEPHYIMHSAAVNQTLIYFVTYNGILYKYDSILKTVTNCGRVDRGNSYASLIIVNDILYIHRVNKFYSFDGIMIKEITTPETRQYPVLFQFGDNVCRVGVNTTDVYPDPVACYDPKYKTWTVRSYINEARGWSTVVGTGSKTYIFGGYQKWANGMGRRLKSVEVFNHDTKIWSFAPSPIFATASFYQAVIFHF